MISLNEKTKVTVIIDAANILRDDRGCIIRDQQGERQTQMRTERLQALINVIVELGATPVAILRKGTYFSGKKKAGKESPRFGDWGIVEQGIEQGVIHVVGDQDDESAIQLTMKKSHALLVSRDKFRDHRKKHPEYDWTRLEKLIISDYHFIEGEFISPSLSEKISEHMKLINQSDLDFTQQSDEPTAGPKSNQKSPVKQSTSPLEASGADYDEMMLLDELYAGVYTLSLDNHQFHMSEILTYLAREFLGLEGYAADFPKGWVGDLKSMLCRVVGGNLRPSTWVKQNLPAGFTVVGENVVFDD